MNNNQTERDTASVSDDSSDQSPSPSPSHSFSSPRSQHASFAAARLAARGGRTRTISESEKIMASPTLKGIVISFCREKGHGFIKPDDGGEQLFMHISDIEGDVVPKAGDIVTYKRCAIPPKRISFSAVHVQLVHLNEAVPHEKWFSYEEPAQSEVKSDS